MDRLDGIQKREHMVSLNSRNQLAITGVQYVDTFDDSHIVVHTDMGRLTVKGHGLKIQHLDLDHGEFVASGEVDGVIYSQRALNAGRASGWKKLWG